MGDLQQEKTPDSDGESDRSEPPASVDNLFSFSGNNHFGGIFSDIGNYDYNSTSAVS